MPYYKIFIKNIGLVGFAHFLYSLKGFILLPILTKLLGVSGYGIWVQISITISLITPIAVLGLHNGLIRFLPEEKSENEVRDSIYSVAVFVLASVLVISGFLFLFSYNIMSFLKVPDLFIKLLSVILVFECLDVLFINIFRALQKISIYVFFMIFQLIGDISLVSLSLVLGYGLKGALISLIIIRVSIFLITLSLLIKKIGISFPSFSKIKKYIMFSLPIVVSGIAYWIVQSSDRYLIGFYLDITNVGYYSTAYATGNILNLFIIPLSIVLFPMLSNLYAINKIKQIKIYLSYSLKYLLILIIPAAFGLSVLSHSLLSVLTTEKIADRSQFITPFISLSIVLYGIYTIFFQVLFIYKKTSTSGIVWVVTAVLNIVLNIFFIPQFGIIGAAISTLISFSLALVLIVYYSMQYFDFNIDWQSIFKSILSSLFMSLVIIYFNPSGLIQIISAVFVGMIIYVFTFLSIRGINKSEANMIKDMFFKL